MGQRGRTSASCATSGAVRADLQHRCQLLCVFAAAAFVAVGLCAAADHDCSIDSSGVLDNCACGMTSLYLRRYSISEVADSAFSSCGNVQEINLSKATVATFPSDVFSGLTSLEKLILWAVGPRSGSLVYPADIFSGLTSLKTLDLSSNYMETLPEGIFTGLTALQTLNLGYCSRWLVVPEGLLAGLASLTELYLTSTQWSAFPQGLLSGLAALEDLTLSHNSKLTTFPAGAFAGLTALTRLEMAYGHWTTLPEGLFAGLTALKTLLMSNGKWTTLPEGLLAGLTSLETLTISYCTDLTTLAEGFFAGLTSLKSLRMESGAWTTLPAGIFTGLDTVTYLDLGDSPLTVIAAGIFADLSSVDTLYLTNGQLETLPEGIFAACTKLRYLYMNGGKFATLPEGLFSGLASLYSLRLYNNKLAALPKGLFAGLTSLDRLELHDNQLSALEDGLFDGLTSLDSMTLQNNQLPKLPRGMRTQLNSVTCDGYGNPGNVSSGCVSPATWYDAGACDFCYDPLPGMELSATTVSLSEAGGTATFNVKLSEAANAQVVLNVSSNAVAVATASPAKLTFTTSTWSTTQTVTLTGVDNDMDAADASVTITVAPDAAATGDASYKTAPSKTVAATVTDDDTAGVTLSTADLGDFLEGSSASLTAKLSSKPASDVVLDIAGSSVSFDVSSLTFTATNWASTQTVTVTGDAVTSDTSTTITVAVKDADTADAKYKAVADQTVAANVLAAGLVLSKTTATVAEDGGTDTLTVKLVAAPAGGDVVLHVSSGDTGIATATPAKLTFTTSTWSTTQTVTLTGVDNDMDAADASVTITVAPDAAATGDVGYKTVTSATVSVTSTDDDTAGIILSSTALGSFGQGGSTTFTVQLATQPTGSVVIDMSGATVSFGASASLTFSTSNWNTAQTVTVTGASVSAATPTTITVAVNAGSTDDAVYDAVSSKTASATILDVGLVLSKTSATVSENGGTTTFTVKLVTAPSDNVVVDVTAGSAAATVAPAKLTFTASNWSTAQTVTVTGVDNDVDAAGDASAAITVAIDAAATADAAYKAVPSASATVTTTDDDTADFVVSTAAVSSSESASAAFTVQLDSKPVSGTVVLSTATSNAGVATVAPAKLTFTGSNWNSAQTVTVTGVNNDVDAAGDASATITVALVTGSTTAPDYTSSIADKTVAATLTDDDVAGISAMSSGDAVVVAEPATADDIGVRLDSKPTGNVVMTVTSSDVDVATLSPSSLTFTAANWNTQQTCTITAVNNQVADGSVGVTARFTVQSTGSATEYAAVQASVSAVRADDEQPSLVASATSVSLDEAGMRQASYTIVLDTEPVAPVTVSVVLQPPVPGVELSTSSLVFNSSTWDAPVPVVVTLTADGIDGDATFTIVHAVAATSGSYTKDMAVSVTGEAKDKSLPGYVVPLVIVACAMVVLAAVVLGWYCCCRKGAKFAKVAPDAGDSTELKGMAMVP